MTKLAFRTVVICAILCFFGCALPLTTRARLAEVWNRGDSLRGDTASPLHQRIFGTSIINGPSYHRFFDERIQEIESEGWGYASCHGALACTDRSGKLRLSRQWDSLFLPPLIRLSILLHEARHAEGWEHVICPGDAPSGTPYQNADLRGSRACDDNERGAYGIQYLWLINLSRSCSTCNSAERQQLDAYAEFILRLIVNPSARARLRDDLPPNP